MNTRLVKAPAVKKLAHEKGKRVSSSFLYALDAFVHRKIMEAIVEHNGGKKTLDAELAGVVGIRA